MESPAFAARSMMLLQNARGIAKLYLDIAAP